jgi:hypothetical protein
MADTPLDTPPDRLSLDPRSPHFDAAILRRGIGIRFKGRERHDVEEYSVSEGWIRVQAGKTMDRHGRPLTIKLTGEVEPYFVDGAEGGAAAEGEAGGDGA